MPIEAAVSSAPLGAPATPADALVLFLRPTPTIPAWFADAFPELAPTLTRLIELGEITGDKGNVVTLHALERPFLRVITCGLGSKLDVINLMHRFADMTRDLRTKNIERFHVVVPDYLFPGIDPTLVTRGLAGAGTIGCYNYHRFMADEAPLLRFQGEFLTPDEAGVPQIAAAAARGKDLGHAVIFSRDLCNLPGNYATPAYIAERAQEMAEQSQGTLKATVLGPDEMRAEGMNLLLAVARGSEYEPRMICLDYEGDPGNPHRIALVGKTVTFDAGGISIKPSQGMMQMKRDKMGGTNVLGLASCIPAWRPKLNLSFLIPAAENMPDGDAYRPGDCYQAMNGTWVEINSTDAEGRLVLADALTWAQRYRKPKVLVDMATLTGGAQMALGGGMIAGFSNDDATWDKVARASKASGEDIWRLPLYQPYKKGVRSYFAQTKNSSTTPPSTIKAALFLEEWIDEGVDWVHLDIAASMSQNRPSGILTRGATGMGLVLVADLLEIFEREGF